MAKKKGRSQHDFKMDAAAYYHARTALTGADQTIALGATYRNVRVWLDSGSSTCYIALTGAANNDDPLLEDNMILTYPLDEDGASSVYIESTGSAGYINVEAWG